MGLLSRPAVRNALGLHSPSRCMAGVVWRGLAVGMGGGPFLHECDCSCRRCRRGEHAL